MLLSGWLGARGRDDMEAAPPSELLLGRETPSQVDLLLEQLQLLLVQVLVERVEDRLLDGGLEGKVADTLGQLPELRIRLGDAVMRERERGVRMVQSVLTRIEGEK